ncbi:MAG: MFS transporter [Akkermansiaceae bacterium]
MENRKSLLTAGFLALVAAGVGFGVRAGLLSEWSTLYGFTSTELGAITGAGLAGFGLFIFITSLVIDVVGYKKLMLMSLLCHITSGVMLFFTTAAFNAGGKEAAFTLLYWSMFIFAVGNGICEGVINPLTSTLFPEKKTHYLNLLHAGWPAGLVIGGLISFGAGMVRWEFLQAAFLIPAAIYGFITVKNKFPKTAAQEGATSYGAMLKSLIGPFFVILLITHICVGYVELGTDSWINKITSAILASAALGTALFIYTSLLMTALRFFAGPIVHRISSLGLLFVSALLGATGLYLISIGNSVPFMFFAATVYALGKTFLWPTMLGVVGERFPKSATIGMGLLGTFGMLSAGYLGGPGIGYKVDYYSTQEITQKAPESYERVKAPDASKFLVFPEVVAIDGAKAGMLADNAERVLNDVELAGDAIDTDKYEALRGQRDWWEANKEFAETDAAPVLEAGLYGSRMAIRLTALIPLTMAGLYLLLMALGKTRPIQNEE